MYGMSMDDRDITPEALCRFDWCLRIPDSWDGDDDINVRELPACLLVSVTMEGDNLQTEDRIWQFLWRYWLPHSDYSTDQCTRNGNLQSLSKRIRMA